MKIMKLLLILSLLLSACSTTRTPIDIAVPAHWSQVTAHNKLLPDTTSKVVVVRDTGFIGSFRYFALVINEEVAGLLDEGEQATFYVKPGKLQVSVGRNPIAAMWLAGQAWVPIHTTIKMGETKRFRVGVHIDSASWIPFLGIFPNGSRGLYIQPYDDPDPEPLEGEPYEDGWE